MSTLSYIDVHFPKSGIDMTSGFEQQPVRLLPATQSYSRSTPVALNCRGYDPDLDRVRGGSRSGLTNLMREQVSGSHLVQDIQTVIGTGYSAPGGTVQRSQSGRVVTVLAVSNGNVKTAQPGATSWQTPTNGLGALNTTGVVMSAVNNQKVWFADGVHWKYYDPFDDTVKNWVATAGTLPADASGNKPRLICTWRARTVLSGLLQDPQNWFMSAVNNPQDFDYSPSSTTPTQAVAGNFSPAGLVGDVITCLIPYTDDVLVIGGDSTIWLLSGDPMEGGRVNRVTNAVGMAWGAPCCMDPFGNIYFVSNRTGIYTMVPGQQPVRISQQIEQLITGVNTGQYTIRLLWDDRQQGVHVYITRTAGPAGSFHLFYELRTGGWFADYFTNPYKNPLCCCVFDGNTANDRVPLIGSWDGYVRSVDVTALDDDGDPIVSDVLIGPLRTKDLDDVKLKEVQALLGETSGTVTYAIHVGTSAENALASEPIQTGEWGPGRNLTDYVRQAAHAIYIRISATVPWAMESLRCSVIDMGKVRRRGA